MAAVAVTAALLACSPTFNWREVRIESTGLKAMFPCKPDHAARNVDVAGRPVSLQALACEAGGATFAVLFADADPGSASEFLGRWQAAMLAGLHSTTAKQSKPFRPSGALELPQSLQIAADGKRAEGHPVQGRAAFFAHGRQVFQAVVYADALRLEVTDPFFSGLVFE